LLAFELIPKHYAFIRTDPFSFLAPLSFIFTKWFAFSINRRSYYAMTTIKRRLAWISSATALWLLAFPVNAGVSLINLGTLGGDFSTAVAINNRGQIVGWGTSSDGTTHAFSFQNGLLSVLNSDPCVATAINDAGRIVGYSELGPFTNELGSYNISQAVLFNRSLLINLIPGTNDSTASGINNSSQVVGTYGLPNGATHAFVYRNGLITDLGTLGGDFSDASGINNRGDVVGESNVSSPGGPVHPLLYHHNKMYDLGTLGGSISAALAINDAGDVVGYSTTAKQEQHPFLYRHGRMHDLGTLGDSQPHSGGLYNYATAINNFGEIVGQATTANGAYHAFVYRNGKITDLNHLVKLTTTNGPPGFLVLITANGINDRRQVVGVGSFWDGAQVTGRAFLLSLAR
jgi:probable HAF family extracellular repeat protein